MNRQSREGVGSQLPEDVEIPLSPSVEGLLERARAISDELASTSVEPAHLLIALLERTDTLTPDWRMIGRLNHSVRAKQRLENQPGLWQELC
jgi:hypothetical protein